MTDLNHDLDELLAEPEPDYDTDPIPASTLVDVDNRLRHIARIQRKADEVCATAEAARARARDEIAEIDAWQVRELDKIAKARSWWERGIHQFQRQLFARQKERTLTLPHGVLKAAKRQPVYVVSDSEAFMDWAVAAVPALINPGTPKPAVPSPDLRAIKASVKSGALAVGGWPSEHRVEVPLPLVATCLGTGEEPVIVPGVTVTLRDDEYTIEVTA